MHKNQLQADTFGDCAIPTIAWQIDPFGHSKEQVDVDQYIDEHDDNVKLSSKGASLCGNGL